MAESQRQSKRKPKHKVDEDDEAAQKRRNTMWLVVFGVCAVLIVAGMVLLSMFLSGRIG